ncbi:MAG: hypothetical protein IKT55_07095, partial [Clostridia bacterium]|nr:hypothetical protein [Clostridia bacterium]
MEKKKSFIFYYDWWDIFEPMTPIQRGELLTEIYRYIREGIEPEYTEYGMKIAFNVIRNTLNRDADKYERVCKRNSENGKKGGRPKKETQETQWVFEKPKKADNDNDNDKVTSN